MRRTAALGLALALLLVPLGAVSAEAAPRPAVSLVLAVSGTQQRGDAVPFAGRVLHVPRGTPVAVQRLAGLHWRTVATVRTVAGARFRGSFTSTTLGRTTFRAAVAAAKGRPAAASRTRSIVLVDRFALTAVKPVRIDAGVTAAVEVGDPGAGSLVYTFTPGDRQTLEVAWDLKGGCEALTFFAGTESGTAHLSVQVSDAVGAREAYSTDLRQQDPVQARVDARDVRVLIIAITDTTPTAGVHVAGVAQPTVVCSKDPSRS